MTTGRTALERARVALTHSPIPALRCLDVEQSGKSLVISGRVSSFYQKQMAQEAIRAVCQNTELFNTVAVADVASE